MSRYCCGGFKANRKSYAENRVYREQECPPAQYHRNLQILLPSLSSSLQRIHHPIASTISDFLSKLHQENSPTSDTPHSTTTIMSQPQSMQYAPQQSTEESGHVLGGNQQFAAWKLDEERQREDDKARSGLCADCAIWSCLGWLAR
jgi:hypothetical protein